MPLKDKSTHRNKVVEAFAKSYERQKPILTSLFSRVWGDLSINEQFEATWFQFWLDGVRDTHNRLINCQKNELLEIPRDNSINNYIPFSKAHQSRWIIYISYVHMLNNRLGIQNHDEGYLGYIMRENFQLLIK